MADLGNRTNVNAAIDLLLDDAQPNEAIQPSDHNGLLKDILDTLANGLSVTLRTGNTTSGQNIEVTSGDTIDFDNSSFLGSLTSGTLTAARTYTLPDKTGTVAMLSDVENILNTNGLILGGNYTHDLNSNNLGMFGGSIGIGDDLTVISSDATKFSVANFVGASTNSILYVDNQNDNVGIGDSAPHSSAKLEITSTDSGLLIPRMSTTQRNGIGSPTESLMIYNTTDDQFEFYDSLGAWSTFGGGGASIYTADGVLTGNRIVDLDTNVLTFDAGTTTTTAPVGLVIDSQNVFSTGTAAPAVLKVLGLSGNEVFNLNSRGYFISTSDYTTAIAKIINRAGTQGLTLANNVSDIATGQFRHLATNSDNTDRIEQTVTNVYQQWIMNKNNVKAHWIRNGDSAAQASFFLEGITGRGFKIGTDIKTASEDITFYGSTIIRGKGTTTGTTLALYDDDTTPNITWEWLDNGNVITGQDNFIYFQDEITVLSQSDLNTKFRVSNGDDKTTRIFVGGNSGGFEGLQLQYFGNNTAVDANMRGKQVMYGEFNHGELIIANNASGDNAEIWFNISDGQADDWFINKRRAKITKDDFKIHNVSGLIYHPTDDEPTKIGTENVSLQGDVLMSANVNMPNLPTSSAGLSAGDIWNDGGTLKIV